MKFIDCSIVFPVNVLQESSGLNPNASEFHSRFTSSMVECEIPNIEHCSDENSELIEALEHTDLSKMNVDFYRVYIIVW
jgi:hypothetical protein